MPESRAVEETRMPDAPPPQSKILPGTGRGTTKGGGGAQAESRKVGIERSAEGAPPPSCGQGLEWSPSPCGGGTTAFTLAKALPSRTTTPGTPPSRTIRLEPRPSAITGVVGSRLRRNCCRSARSFGSNSHSALPPDLNHTSGASGALAVSLPATRGRSSAIIRPSVPQSHQPDPPPTW